MERQVRHEVDRQQIAAVMASLRLQMKSRLDAGLLPYDGRWVPLADVQEGIVQEHKRARVHAVELILLYCLILTASLLVVALVWLLCY